LAANDLADLNSRFTVALKDAGHTIWPTAEKDEILQQSVRQLWPRFSRPLDPLSTVFLEVDEAYYDLPNGTRAVSRIDLIDPNGGNLGAIPGRSWEVLGDLNKDTGQLHINPALVRADHSLYVTGYGVYDTSANLIPDEFAPLVLARARAEAYRRIAVERVRFKEWLARNQTQNVSVNELTQFINEADAEANRLVATTPRTWQKPVPAHSG